MSPRNDSGKKVRYSLRSALAGALRTMTAPHGFIYLATPYTRFDGGLGMAFEAAAAVAGDMVRRDLRVYSPIVHSHALCAKAGLDPLDWKFWMDQQVPFLLASDVLVVALLPGYFESAGVTQEIRQAEELGKPVIYWPTTGLWPRPR